jgi:hypothetical protein
VDGFSPYTYHWDFGDGETSEEQNPIHNYDAVGTYIATITVTDRKGYVAINSTTATIAEELMVEASPYVVEGLVNEPIHLYGFATGGFPQYTWHWDFGDGNFSDEQNPVHLYSRADLYYVSLRVEDRLSNYDYAYSGAKITKEKNPIIEIRKPKKALYINNIKILSFFTPIIIGWADILVKTEDAYFEIDRVEFYIDNELKHYDTQTDGYCSWTWNEQTPFKFRHTLKVIAYDRYGFYNSDELTVWKFF